MNGISCFNSDHGWDSLNGDSRIRKGGIKLKGDQEGRWEYLKGRYIYFCLIAILKYVVSAISNYISILSKGQVSHANCISKLFQELETLEKQYNRFP